MSRPHSIRTTVVVALIVVLGLAAAPSAQAVGPMPVGLGTATSFAVLAGAGITVTGSGTIVNGDIGSFPTTSIGGFPPGTLNGANHSGDDVTQSAKTALVAAYNDVAGRTPVTIVPTELGGTNLGPGVYSSDAGTFGITGNLTLNGLGDPTSVFIFQMASTLTTANSSTVTLTNGAQACNVFWQVGSSATLGGSTSFRGNILALTSVTLVTGATVDGRVLARNGAVTLDTNTITRAGCAEQATTPPATATPVPTVAPGTPAPAPGAPTATPATPGTPTAAPATPARAATSVSLPSSSTIGPAGAAAPIGLLLASLGFLLYRHRRSAPPR